MSTGLTVTHVTAIDWAVFAITSGLAAAVFNQIAGGILTKFQRSSDQHHQNRLQQSQQEFQACMQKDAREDESLQLLIKSHFDQRDKLLSLATESYSWINFQIFRNYGNEYDVYDYNEPLPEFENVAEVIGNLRVIAQTHPTRSVRALARGLKSSIGGHYSDLVHKVDKSGDFDYPEVGGTPSPDQLFRWLKDADALIELMHKPPSLEEVRKTSEAGSAGERSLRE